MLWMAEGLPVWKRFCMVLKSLAEGGAWKLDWVKFTSAYFGLLAMKSLRLMSVRGELT